MSRLQTAIAHLETCINTVLEEMQNDPMAPKGIESRELAHDIILADLGHRGLIDHLRLVKLEAMLSFILRKNVVEGRRRPTSSEAAALGKDVENFVTKRTWMDDFSVEWGVEQARLLAGTGLEAEAPTKEG